MTNKRRMEGEAASGVAVTVNGGSSSIKFAAFTGGNTPARIASGSVERIGLPGTELAAAAPDGRELVRRGITARTHQQSTN